MSKVTLYRKDLRRSLRIGLCCMFAGRCGFWDFSVKTAAEKRGEDSFLAGFTV